jgi:hypothetical protein
MSQWQTFFFLIECLLLSSPVAFMKMQLFVKALSGRQPELGPRGLLVWPTGSSA